MFCGGKVEREPGLRSRQSRQRWDVTDGGVNVLIGYIRP